MWTRLERAQARGLTTFVGRDKELGVLEGALERALSADGQIVGVVGQPGVGKSRLCLQFALQCHERGLRLIEAHCPQHGKTQPFGAILQLLRSAFGLREEERDAGARERVISVLTELALEESAPLLLDFLGMPDRLAPDVGASDREGQLLRLVGQLVEAQSARQATVVLVDDAHWIDESSDTFLAAIAAAVKGTRTLLLVNYRPEYAAVWMSGSGALQLPLAVLGPENAEALLESLVGDRRAHADLFRRIVEHTGGNPFFLEEVVRGLIEEGSLDGEPGAYALRASLESLGIPATVRAVLAARIDRLGEREKRVLQKAAVIGREVSEALLAGVARLPEIELDASLARLRRGEFLHEVALFPDVVLEFKHPLTREVAYESQLRERRARTHGAVAWKLQELQPDGSLQHAALIAEHLERAGDLVPAAAWHLQASVWFGTTSLSESLDRARRALSLLEGATATESQLQAQVPQRIEFAATQTILGFGQPMGISREEADAAFERGKAALAALSDVEPRELALLCFYYSSAAHVYTGAALELGEEAWALVERTGDPGARLVVGTARAGVLLEAGHLRTAYDHVRQLTEHLPEDVGEIKGYGGRSPLLSLLAYEGELVSRLGNPARGLLRLEEAFALAASSGDLARCSQVASAGARACFFMGDLPGAASWAERCVSIAKRTGTLAGALAANRSLRCAHVLARDWEELRRVAEQALEMEGPSSLRPRACLAHGLARLGSRKWVGALPIEIFEESLEQRPDLKDAALHCAWALIRGAGAAEQDRIEAALDGCEASMQHSEEPSRLPQVHAARAALARLLGDEAECQHEFDEVLRLAAEMGATGWVDWCAQELEELRLSRASPE